MASIWRRKDRDAWVVDYFDAAGRRRRLVAATREKAENLLAEKIKESRQAAPVCDNPETTVEEYAARWLDAVAASLKPRTHASYAQILKLYVLPAFGKTKLRAVHHGHVKALLAQKAKDGLSKNTLRLIRACVSVLLGSAVEDGILTTNAAMQYGRRRAKRVDSLSRADRQKNIRALSPAQLAAFLDATAEEPAVYGALFFTLARTGLRPGEALALQPEDLDFSARSIHVERALSAGDVGTTKTGETRRVDMSERLGAVLQDLLVLRERQKLRHGWAEMPALLFFNERGQALDLSRVRKHFARALKRAGLSGFRVYDLRHSFATSLLAAGAPITYVSAQLGHAKPTTTLQWYSHWLPTADSHRFVDGLDQPAGILWHQLGTKRAIGDERRTQALEKIEAGARIRTADLLITNFTRRFFLNTDELRSTTLKPLSCKAHSAF
jgi:integrase